MEYYYAHENKIDLENKLINLTGDEFKHLAKVLRKKPGDKIQLTDGKYNVYTCVIEDVTVNSVVCQIHDIKKNLYEPKIRLNLYLSLLRNMSRFETAIEKSVEIGVHSITPVITEHTISKSKPGRSKIERFEKIILSAMKQSQRCYLPFIDEILYFNELLEHTRKKINKIVMYEFEELTNDSIKVNGDEASLLIGPEGGFSEKEISSLKQYGWQGVSLGKRKYRAETAAIISTYKILKS